MTHKPTPAHIAAYEEALRSIENNRVQAESEAQIRRASDANAYLTGTVDCAAANRMIWELLKIAGWYPLSILSIDALRERLVDGEDAAFESFPEACEMIAEVAESVAEAWEGREHETAADEVEERFREAAEERGITLVERENDDEPGDRPACQVLGGPHHRDSGRGVCIDCGEFLPTADGDHWR